MLPFLFPSKDDEGKKTNEDIVITHMDVTGGGVTVSTGIAPVELQPNVNVTPVHSQVSI